MKSCKNIYNRKTILLFSCVVLFLFAGVGIASAEVTCCTCGTAGAVTDYDTHATTYTGPLGFVGFACIDGDRTCGTTCTTGETSSGVSRVEGRTWEDFVSAGENRWARGDVVTCCACSGTYICDDRNANCDGAGGICGELTYTRETGSFIRKSTTRAVESPAASTGEDEGPLFDPTAPAIQIPVPGFIGFSEVKVESEGESRYIDIPWIGEYFAAIFNWMMAIVGGFATVMIMIGGFIYLTAAGRQGQVQKAKEMVTNALIGLLLAVGSYLILYTINPDLVSFKSIRLDIIKRQEIGFIELLTTEVDTATTTGGPMAGSHTSTFENCPISLTNPVTHERPDRDPRANEFIENISSVIRGSTPREKVIQIADAAAKCGIHFGACGRTVGTINTLAGIAMADRACISTRDGCWLRGSRIRSISATQREYLETVRCTSHNTRSGCIDNSREATRVVYERFRREMPSTWPDSWADELQPGDSFIIYNGNSSRFGTHFAIFMGWATGGRAQVIQGAYNRSVWEGTICIKSACSPNPKPLIKTFRAQ